MAGTIVVGGGVCGLGLALLLARDGARGDSPRRPGRGVTVGFLQARELRDALRQVGGDPAALARDYDARTEARVAPWYHAQIAVDRARFAQIEALRAGREPPAPADELARNVFAVFPAAVSDPDVFRALFEYIGTVTPIPEILERPAIRAAIEAVGDAAPMGMPGPDRAQLLDLVG